MKNFRKKWQVFARILITLFISILICIGFRIDNYFIYSLILFYHMLEYYLFLHITGYKYITYEEVVPNTPIGQWKSYKYTKVKYYDYDIPTLDIMAINNINSIIIIIHILLIIISYFI